MTPTAHLIWALGVNMKKLILLPLILLINACYSIAIDYEKSSNLNKDITVTSENDNYITVYSLGLSIGHNNIYELEENPAVVLKHLLSDSISYAAKINIEQITLFFKHPPLTQPTTECVIESKVNNKVVKTKKTFENSLFSLGGLASMFSPVIKSCLQLHARDIVKS